MSVTKRLHVSGLTTAFSEKDIIGRFSSFGTVQSLEGFGLTDALGQQRKFAYLTLQASQKDIDRCRSFKLCGTTIRIHKNDRIHQVSLFLAVQHGKGRSLESVKPSLISAKGDYIVLCIFSLLDFFAY
jgi:hypothetical protein